MATDNLRYKRSRFATLLPRDRLYTLGHQWVGRQDDGLWRVGMTKFATRMLGDLVEVDFEVSVNDDVEVGQEIGWVEGFKAVTDLYTPLAGRFAGPNPRLEDSIESVDRDPYGEGWLFLVEGEPGEDLVDVQGYVSFLDETIDRMTGRAG